MEELQLGDLRVQVELGEARQLLNEHLVAESVLSCYKRIKTYGYIRISLLVEPHRESLAFLTCKLTFELLDLCLEVGHVSGANLLVFIAPLVHLVPHGVFVVSEEVCHELHGVLWLLLLCPHCKQD